MILRRVVASLAGLSCAVVAGGCSLDSTGPKPADARVQSIFQTAAFPIGLTGVTGGVVAPTATTAPADCAFNEATGWFVCAAAGDAGLTITRQFALFDESGQHLTALDWKRAAAMRTTTHVSGTTTHSANVNGGTFNFTLALDRADEMIVSGLLTTHRVLSGVSSGTTVFTSQSSQFTAHITSTQVDTTTGLTFDATGATHWPLGGTISSHSQQLIDNGAGGSNVYSIGTRIVFDGTSVVTITTTGSFGTRTCTIDLNRSAATSIAAPVCS